MILYLVLFRHLKEFISVIIHGANMHGHSCLAKCLSVKAFLDLKLRHQSLRILEIRKSKGFPTFDPFRVFPYITTIRLVRCAHILFLFDHSKATAQQDIHVQTAHFFSIQLR